VIEKLSQSSVSFTSKSNQEFPQDSQFSKGLLDYSTWPLSLPKNQAKTMKISITFLFTIFALLTISGCHDLTVQEQFKKHITYLASDELEGREAGTESEKKAAQYVAKEFRQIGLNPKGTDGYFQQFNFMMGKIYGENEVRNGDTELAIDDDFFPLNYSGNGLATGEVVNAGFGIEAPDLSYSDYTDIGDVSGKIVQFSVSSPDGIHPHSEYIDYHNVRNRVKLAESKGAVAVILTNEDPNASDPKKDYTEKMAKVSIPVIFISKTKKLSGSEVTIRVELKDDERQAQNVVGYIDNGRENTIVFGAHFDHLGYGIHGGSLYRGEEMIHNGADDNASGTSMLIELSREISKSTLTSTNFLFIAFSGEEKGLLGANYYTKNPTIDLEKVDYMINMDMVGRLDTADYNLAINGVGSSPSWEAVLNEQVQDPISIVTSESGVGPSDHTSFYLADIPVLHFFTGTHENYHKPSDDEPLINYNGMEMVYNYILRISTSLDQEEKLAFTKTKDSESRSAPSFNVTLGIVPDYMYDKGGVRVDGVSDGKPGDAAGLEKGDIVMKLGDYDTDDMYAYMEALSKLNKGDKVSAEIKRGDEIIILEVQF